MDEIVHVTDRLAPAGATVGDLATIELRRITDVLQVDHASLFLAEPGGAERAALIASTGIPLEEALPSHASVVARVVATGRSQHVQHVQGDPRGARSALATPLLDAQRPIGALLVATLRETRRFGMFEAQVIGRATETLMARILTPRRRGVSDRFVRGA
ncbi:MAG TPA: GAF domain-containing protein [Solirubrobacteraceae bacterium]